MAGIRCDEEATDTWADVVFMVGKEARLDIKSTTFGRVKSTGEAQDSDVGAEAGRAHVLSISAGFCNSPTGPCPRTDCILLFTLLPDSCAGWSVDFNGCC
jgi:hypothetical protein